MRPSLLIAERLRDARHTLAREFQAKTLEAKHCILDDLLPEWYVRKVYDSFPSPCEMKLTDTFRERKYTTKVLDNPLIREITLAFQRPQVLRELERIIGMSGLIPDPSLYAGGLSLMQRGHYLQPHIDNSHDSQRYNYRVLNLLYYVTPQWPKDAGGNLELWDPEVTKPLEIHARFNRLVIMATCRTSYHSVNAIEWDGKRCCIANYYFSRRSLEGADYFHVTSFKGRPENPLLRLRCAADTLARSLVRSALSRALI